jgi:hypothetical protein
VDFPIAPEFKTARFKVANGDGVDLMGPGTQIVIPGTIHPDTGRPYQWREDGEPLERVAPEKLPPLRPDIVDIVREIMKPRGWTEPAVREYARGGGRGSLDGLKDEAMARVREWLPALGVPYKGNRAVAVWRGGDGYNVQIYPDGFHDFGGGRNEQLSAIDIAMAVRNETCGEAVKWLKDRLLYEDPEPEAEIFSFKTGERIEEPEVEEEEEAPDGAEQPEAEQTKAEQKDESLKPKQPIGEAFQAFDPDANLEARDWLYGQHYQRGFVTGTLAMTKTGKSTKLLTDAVAMTTGRGDIPQRRRPLVDGQAFASGNLQALWSHKERPGRETLCRIWARGGRRVRQRQQKRCHLEPRDLPLAAQVRPGKSYRCRHSRPGGEDAPIAGKRQRQDG